MYIKLPCNIISIWCNHLYLRYDIYQASTVKPKIYYQNFTSNVEYTRRVYSEWSSKILIKGGFKTFLLSEAFLKESHRNSISAK